MIGILAYSLGLALGVASASTDWSQPPVGCIEDVIYSEPSYACLDLTDVADPLSDFPAGMSASDITMWKTERAKGLTVCRAHEILRRDEKNPGSEKPGEVELAWMRVLSLKDTSGKIDEINQASERTGMPSQVLFGALTQESLMADLGLAADGGNYSCGIGQLNIQEWCRFAQAASPGLQRQMGWPRGQSSEFCSDPVLTPSLAKPFYEIGLKNLGAAPSYRLLPEHLKNIKYEDVVGEFPAASDEIQRTRFSAVQSFLMNCSDYRYGIPAKAHELERIFHTSVPEALQKVQTYPDGESFHRSCRGKAADVYPLHTGWLLADAIYNAGPGIVPALEYYLDLDAVSTQAPTTWADFQPTDLISALYWAGKYNPATGLLESFDFDGHLQTRTYYKSCVVQRHIARVIQHVTLPGYLLADTLEGPGGCSKSVVPSARQVSSGRIR